MKILLQLLHQYKGDVEQRIMCIKYDRDNDEAGWVDPDIVDDYEAQIAHWEATLKQIDKALAKYDEAIQIKLISVLYKWVCPDCGFHNKGSELNEQVVCSGCSKPFKINFGNTP